MNLSSITKALRSTFAHSEGRIRLSENPKNAGFVQQALSIFDQVHHRQLLNEQRILAGEVSTQNTFVPASFSREVIREAYADLPILELIQPRTDPAASISTAIPYEERTVSIADLPNDGIVFEGKPIPFAGASLRHETAYIQAVKLALKVSNEVIHFSAANGIDWNAWADNIASNARVIRELLHFRLAKEIQRAADSYQAISISNEAVTANDEGIVKTAQFPVVQPFQKMDLRGVTVGNPENPIQLIIDGAAVAYHSGGTLAPGLYWKFKNINLGYIQLVDDAGAPAGAGKTGTLSYDYATNLLKFDLNHPTGVAYPDHLNGLLNTIADAKAVLTGKRICRPEFGLMSSTLNAEAAKASQFAISLTRPGTSTTSGGDLEAIKGLPIWEAQGGHVGDERVLLGQRGTTAYTIAKPWTMAQPFDAVDSNGQPTGEKAAYGEEYSAICTPKAIRGRYMSVLVFDSAKR